MIEPMHDYVLVEPIPQNMSAGGIVLPETATEQYQFNGKVVAVGPGKWGPNGERQAIDLNVGDVVVFSRQAGWKVESDGKKLLAIHDSDLIAKSTSDINLNLNMN